MGITYEEATSQLHQWTDNPSLLQHARAVELAMRAAAALMARAKPTTNNGASPA